jgi:hypothetical protein
MSGNLTFYTSNQTKHFAFANFWLYLASTASATHTIRLMITDGAFLQTNATSHPLYATSLCVLGDASAKAASSVKRGIEQMPEVSSDRTDEVDYRTGAKKVEAVSCPNMSTSTCYSAIRSTWWQFDVCRLDIPSQYSVVQCALNPPMLAVEVVTMYILHVPQAICPTSCNHAIGRHKVSRRSLRWKQG